MNRSPRWRARRRRFLDLDGRLAIAGVNDAHDHIGEVPFGRVVSTATPPLADPPLDEVMAAVARASADPPDHERRLSYGRRE